MNTNTVTTNNWTAPTGRLTTGPAPGAWIGLDWGHSQHAYVLREASGQILEGTLPSSPEHLHGWLQQLQEKYPNPVLALEGTPPGVMAVLAQYPTLTVYCINPTSSERFRKAFVPSGAKDDLPDARVLLDMVFGHADKFRPWEAPDELTQQLDGLVRARRQVVDRRTRTGQRLTDLLRQYYPQALELAGQFNGSMAIEFLKRWPDLLSLKAARPGTLKTFYHRHNVRSSQVVEQRLESIRQARALTTQEAIVSVAVLQVQELVEELALYQKHLAKFDHAITAVFKQHPDAHLFSNLPGAGQQMAPRLCAAFGSDRSRFADAQSFQKYAGVVPVIQRSGQQCWVHWRWNASKFVRQSLVEWAGLSVRWSSWAKRFYDRARVAKKRHSVIIRALAAKWVRILWKCWSSHTPYDEATYLQQLARRKSQYAA